MIGQQSERLTSVLVVSDLFMRMEHEVNFKANKEQQEQQPSTVKGTHLPGGPTPD